MKEIVCLLCGLPGTQFNLNEKECVTTKHPENVTGIICSRCIQALLLCSQEQIKKYHRRAIHEELIYKAEVLESFLEEENLDERKTKKPQRNPIRKRLMRLSGPAHYNLRQKQTAL